jgi:hypothetical protein
MPTRRVAHWRRHLPPVAADLWTTADHAPDRDRHDVLGAGVAAPALAFDGGGIPGILSRSVILFRFEALAGPRFIGSGNTP